MTEQITPEPHDGKRIATAAKMAGEWWAARLADKYSDRRLVLASAIAWRVEATLKGEKSYGGWGEEEEPRSPRNSVHVECDYEPKGLLANAVAEVFSDMPGHKLFTSVQDLFPCKHDLLVTREFLRPKEGYGNMKENIEVPQ